MHVLLVEDELNVADFIKTGFSEESFTVDHVRTFVDARHLATHEVYDLIVVDRRLPDGDGLDLVKELRAKGGKAPILILSALAQLDQRVTGLEAGADDYLGKPFAFSELLARARALLRRGPIPLPPVLTFGDIELDPNKRQVLAHGKRVDLTAREFALLQLLMRYSGATLSRTKIGEHVWEYHFEPTSNVIDVCVGRLRKKLEQAGATTKVETIRGAGYTLLAQGGA
jgi:DNA-binding response OmpR family regulator